MLSCGVLFDFNVWTVKRSRIFTGFVNTYMWSAQVHKQIILWNCVYFNTVILYFWDLSKTSLTVSACNDCHLCVRNVSEREIWIIHKKCSDSLCCFVMVLWMWCTFGVLFDQNHVFTQTIVFSEGFGRIALVPISGSVWWVTETAPNVLGSGSVNCVSVVVPGLSVDVFSLALIVSTGPISLHKFHTLVPVDFCGSFTILEEQILCARRIICLTQVNEPLKGVFLSQVWECNWIEFWWLCDAFQTEWKGETFPHQPGFFSEGWWLIPYTIDKRIVWQLPTPHLGNFVVSTCLKSLWFPTNVTWNKAFFSTIRTANKERSIKSSHRCGQ